LIVRLSQPLLSTVDVGGEDLMDCWPQQGEQRLVGCLGCVVNSLVFVSPPPPPPPSAPLDLQLPYHTLSVDIPGPSWWTPPMFAGRRHERQWREEGTSPPQRHRGTQSILSAASWDASPHHSITAAQCVTSSCPPQDDGACLCSSCTDVLVFPVPFANCKLQFLVWYSIETMDFSLALCHWNSREAQAFKCVNQMRNCNVQFASVTRNPEITVQFALSPMLISLDSPDDPFNHVLRMTVLIWCPTRFTFKWAVGLIVDSLDHYTLHLMMEEEDLMEGWPQQWD